MNKTTPKATRLYFKVTQEYIYEKETTFDYHSGFSFSQKQKTIKSFHEKIYSLESDTLHILEVSRKSSNILGQSLSAFNLRYRKYTVESVYQSSKVFTNNTQLKHLLYVESLQAKKEANEYQNDNKLHITHFNFFGEQIPIIPGSLFYDYLYIKAIMEDNFLAKELLKYDCFTDIEFNQKNQISSQARSCAIYVYLAKSELLPFYTNSIDSFKRIYQFLIKKDHNLLSI